MIPGFPEVSTDDALHFESLEDDRVEVDGLLVLAVDAEHGDSTPGTGVLDGELQGTWMAAHFESAIESAGHEFAELFVDVDF